MGANPASAMYVEFVAAHDDPNKDAVVFAEDKLVFVVTSKV